MSYSLNSLRGDYITDYIGEKGDTRSLDYTSHGGVTKFWVREGGFRRGS